MISRYICYKEKATAMRQNGMTYVEIRESLGVKIPKSTFTNWFKDVCIPEKQKRLMAEKMAIKLNNSRQLALVANKRKRESYLLDIHKRVVHLKALIDNIDVAKISLAMLYVAEGSKSTRGTVDFGNSDPNIIRLFMELLKKCYPIDQKKFRLVVQCRADQDILFLEDFWSKLTKISISQFYKTSVDPRTIGKPSRKLDYKGVCRIYYFSADVDLELKEIFKIIMGR